MQETAIDKDWWRGAVIYQIYPRSYQDSNGDGIGDLKGITSRLPYIASLGADAIWISPFFTSPMDDFGYDVSDYCDVDPMFGSLGDFDELVKVAHDLNVKVMIDLVLSHTSNQHEWFKQSRSSRDGEKSDWYVWADAKPDGSPPNNWISIFGGAAWEWDSHRRQYYMHNFLASQPDLNFHNMDVQDALLDATRFWLDRGVDGFRLDTINFYVHSQSLKDNPPLPPERRKFNTAPAANPYGYQSHVYDKSQPENLAFLKRFRSLLDEYPAAAAVGEVGDEERGLEIVADYTSGGDKVHMCYGFDFLGETVPSPAFVHQVFGDLIKASPDSWPCWAFSNHDVPRYASRWPVSPDLQDAANRVRIALLLSMRGSVCLYQGEELGLEEADVAYEDLQDPYGIRFWPDFKGRDGCRTPMVWDESNENAGFSSGKPWLPVAEPHKAKAVSILDKDDGSLLHHYQRLLAFRKAHPSLVKGDLHFVKTDGDVLSFVRQLGDDHVFCAFNLVGEDRDMPFDSINVAPIDGHGFASTIEDGKLKLPAYGAFFGVME
ncbi:alpha-glucosidase [Cohaesibacter celericrescens]|uniref:Alpha-glucosidase n=1 Tax=Cohaesibacter celericrescens TaxID=2067669 RepID=A0A2N5XQZ0_9HYPH|nr:alpha-glucosidase [Cohaesibacter celericrescens]PLW76923.1 alpha-glucosidase [Cohaesibacter celericrescens]